jgi:hypothetical protein
MQDNKQILTTIEPHEEPQAAALIREMKDAIVTASSMGAFEKLKRCHETTKCIWADQQKDGRLGKAKDNNREKSLLFRWPGAPDMAVPLADTIIRWLVMIRTSVFNRGDSRIRPERFIEGEGTSSGSVTEKSAMWQDVVDYFLNKQDWMIAKAYGLFSTCVEEFGFSIIMVDWLKKRRNELCRISLQQLTDSVTQIIISRAEAEALPGQPFDPQQVVDQVELMMRSLIFEGVTPSDDDTALLMEAMPGIPKSEVKLVIKQFIEDADDDAEYIKPQDDGGVPIVEAYIPFINSLTPSDMTGDGQTDWIAIPKYFSESALLETAALEEWDPAVVKQVIDTQKNNFFYEMFSGAGNVPSWTLNGVGISLTPDKRAMQESPRFMVFYIRRKIVNSKGLPMVYKGVLHHNIPDKMLLWEPTNQREIPMLVETSEDVQYAILARGVPEIVADKQNFVKDSINSEGARGQLGSNPPFVRSRGMHVGMRPGLELDGGRGASTFADSKFLDVPIVDQGTIALMDRAERYVRDYYFCHAETDPNDKRMFMEQLSFRSLRCITKLIKILWGQTQENIDDLHVSNIAGRAVTLDVTSRDQLAGEADVNVAFHLDGLNKDSSDKFFEIAGQLLQNDQAGRVDKGELTEIMVSLAAPTYARRLIIPGPQAAEQVIREQDARIAQIIAGVPMVYQQNVSAPEARLQRMQEWLANPENQALAMSNATRQELVQKEMEYLQFAFDQQTINPQAGRTGVKPN